MSYNRAAAVQSKDYDLNGDYVRTWCPELRNVPTSKVHEPWTMSKEEQEKAGCRCVLARMGVGVGCGGWRVGGVACTYMALRARRSMRAACATASLTL